MTAAGLQGRHALVTGGSRGIGRAIAQRLLAEGARVTITGRDAAALAATASALGCDGELADVSDPDAMQAAFAACGAVDILINNAGAALSKPFLKMTVEEWDAMLAVNLTGVFLGCRLALPGMVARGWGRIVTIASTAGHKAYPYTAAYCAAKHGVIGLTRSLALESARNGVTVNAICPGFTETEMADRAIASIAAKTGRSAADARATLAGFNPQNRLTSPEEIADAVVFLCREEAAGITGQSLIIAGGEVMS